MSFILAVVFCVAVLAGSVETARVVFRRSEILAEKNRKAIAFALANFELLMDRDTEMLTAASLIHGKLRCPQSDWEHVDRLREKLHQWGHPTRPGGTIFVISRQELEHLQHRL